MSKRVLAERLKAMRKSHKLTQSQLANELNVALSVIGGAETKRGISHSLAIKLANYFNTDIDYWLDENSEMEFVRDMNLFETTERVVTKLIDENILTLDNIDNFDDPEITELIKRSVILDIKIELKKREQKI